MRNFITLIMLMCCFSSQALADVPKSIQGCWVSYHVETFGGPRLKRKIKLENALCIRQNGKAKLLLQSIRKMHRFTGIFSNNDNYTLKNHRLKTCNTITGIWKIKHQKLYLFVENGATPQATDQPIFILKKDPLR